VLISLTPSTMEGVSGEVLRGIQAFWSGAEAAGDAPPVDVLVEHAASFATLFIAIAGATPATRSSPGFPSAEAILSCAGGWCLASSGAAAADPGVAQATGAALRCMASTGAWAAKGEFLPVCSRSLEAVASAEATCDTSGASLWSVGLGVAEVAAAAAAAVLDDADEADASARQHGSRACALAAGLVSGRAGVILPSAIAVWREGMGAAADGAAEEEARSRDTARAGSTAQLLVGLHWACAGAALLDTPKLWAWGAGPGGAPLGDVLAMRTGTRPVVDWLLSDGEEARPGGEARAAEGATGLSDAAAEAVALVVPAAADALAVPVTAAAAAQALASASGALRARGSDGAALLAESALTASLGAVSADPAALRSVADLERVTAVAKGLAHALRRRVRAEAARGSVPAGGGGAVREAAAAEEAAVSALEAARSWFARQPDADRRSAREEWRSLSRACSKAAGAAACLRAVLAHTPAEADAAVRGFLSGACPRLATPVAVSHAAAAAMWAAVAAARRAAAAPSGSAGSGAGAPEHARPADADAGGGAASDAGARAAAPALSRAVAALGSAAARALGKPRVQASARTEMLGCLAQASSAAAFAASVEAMSGRSALAVGPAGSEGGPAGKAVARCLGVVLDACGREAMDEEAAEAAASTLLSLAVLCRLGGVTGAATDGLVSGASRFVAEARSAMTCLLDDMGAEDPGRAAGGGPRAGEGDDDGAEEDETEADASVGALGFCCRVLTKLLGSGSAASLVGEARDRVAATITGSGFAAAASACADAVASPLGALLGEEQDVAARACGEAKSVAGMV